MFGPNLKCVVFYLEILTSVLSLGPFVIPTILLASHRSYIYHSLRDNSFFFFLFSRSFYHRAQCLFPIILTVSQDSVRFLRPVAIIMISILTASSPRGKGKESNP